MKAASLYSIIKDRIQNKPRGSYVVSLIKKGEDAILQKIGEETIEVLIAVKGKKRQRIIEEISDLYFMTLVFLAYKKISPEEISDELEKRRK